MKTSLCFDEGEIVGGARTSEGSPPAGDYVKKLSFEPYKYL